MPHKLPKFVYWTPRILSILFILFLALFSLDVFDEGLGFWGTVVGLLMHNIPSFVLLAVTLVAWKREIVGAVAFFLAGLAYIALVMVRPDFEWYRIAWIVQISGPAFLIGFLYWLNWKRKKAKNVK